MPLQIYGSLLRMRHYDGRAARKHSSMQLQWCSSPMARGVDNYQLELVPKQPTHRTGLRAWKEVSAANRHTTAHLKVYLQHSRTQNGDGKRLHQLVALPGLTEYIYDGPLSPAAKIAWIFYGIFVLGVPVDGGNQRDVSVIG